MILVGNRTQQECAALQQRSEFELLLQRLEDVVLGTAAN